MGYDPPTHQAWIRIIGLPLQAWTVSEVTSFIQNFGYLLEILPFGRAVGHYRDITALIAMKHPTSIPLAYRYREGDYSAPVDLLLLTWRAWEDTGFPPPPDPNRHANPPVQPHQPHHPNDPTISAHHSSSSSSNNAPSEPTIDYSSWSPRSYRLSLPHAQKWTGKLANACPQTNSKCLQLPLPLFSTGKCSDNPMPTELLPLRHNCATDDPPLLHDFRGIYLLLQTHALSIPNPIPINPLSSLQARYCDGHVLGAARGNSTEPLSRTTSPVRPRTSAALTLAVMQYSPTQLIFLAYLKQKSKLDKGPYKPIRCMAHIKTVFPHQARSAIAHSSLLPSQSPSYTIGAANDGPRFSLSSLSSDAYDDDFLVGPPGYEQRMRPMLLLPSITKENTLELPSSKKGPPLAATHPPFQMSDGSSVLTNPPESTNREHIPQTATTTAARRKRDGRLPTRRSKRLQTL